MHLALSFQPCPFLQVCRELSGEAVDYEEASGTVSDADDALCVLLLVSAQTSQPDLDSLKVALLEVRLPLTSEQGQPHLHPWTCKSVTHSELHLFCCTRKVYEAPTGAVGIGTCGMYGSMLCRGREYCSNRRMGSME